MNGSDRIDGVDGLRWKLLPEEAKGRPCGAHASQGSSTRRAAGTFADLLESGQAEAPDRGPSVESKDIARGADSSFDPAVSVPAERDRERDPDREGGSREARKDESGNESRGSDGEERRPVKDRPQEPPGLLMTARPLVPGIPHAEFRTGVPSAMRIHPELANRIVESVRIGASKEGSREIEIDLKATVLDGMTIRLSREGGMLQVRMMVDRYHARDALESALPELIEKLQARGLDLDGVRVEMRSEAAAGSAGDPDGGSEHRQRDEDRERAVDGEPEGSPGGHAVHAPAHGSRRAAPSDGRTNYSI